MKNVVLLGSTGSIGTSTIKVAADLPNQIRLIGLGAGNNVDLLLEQVREHQPKVISITDPAKAAELRKVLGKSVKVLSGAEGLLELATLLGEFQQTFCARQDFYRFPEYLPKLRRLCRIS